MKIYNDKVGLAKILTPTYFSSAVIAANAVTLSSATTANVTSLDLSAGTFEISFDTYFITTVATATEQKSSLSLTSATLDTTPGMFISLPLSIAALSSTLAQSKSMVKMVFTVPTTIYLPAQATFSLGTIKVYGELRAKKVA